MSFLSDLFFIVNQKMHTYKGDRENISLFIYDDVEQWDREVGYDTEAYCFGTNIIFRSEAEYKDPAVWRHEREHIRQMEACGGEHIFRPAYLLSAAIAHFKYGNSCKNRFEREAIKAEEEE